MNAKDAPFATAMAVLLLGMVRAFDEYPQPSARTVALAGIGLGLAFGSRILAGVAAPCALAALAAHRDRRSSRCRLSQSAARRCGQFIWRLLPALALGYLIMGLLWPWSILAPLNPIRAAEYFDTFFEKPWRELFAGKLYRRDRHAGELPAASVRAQAAGNHAGARTGRHGWRADCRRAARLAAQPPRRAMSWWRSPPSCRCCWRCWRIRPSTMACAISFSWCRHSRCSAASPVHGFSSRARPLGKAATRRARRRLRWRTGAAGERHGAAAPLSVHGIQLGIRRRAHGARQLHARLLGTGVQTGRRGLARQARRDASASRRRADAGPSRSAARSGRRKWRSGPNSKPPGTASAPTSR